MSLVETRDLNAVIENKAFFDQPVKKNQEAYEKFVEITRNNDYTTGNLLDYLYHQKYKLSGIDLSKQTYTSIPQQITFVGKMEEDDDAIIIFIAKKQQKIIVNFSLDSLILAE